MFKNRQWLQCRPPNEGTLNGSAVSGLPQTLDLQNTDPQKPVCLLIDNSYSTGSNGVIGELNEGISTLAELLREDRIAARRTRIAGFSFGGGLRAFTDGFVQASDFRSPVLSPSGGTPMGQSLLSICDHVQSFKEICTEAAVECGVVEILVMGDGMPTDSAKILAAARHAMGQLEAHGIARFHAYVVEGCVRSQLDAVFPRRAEVLSIAEITPFFRSVSHSLRRVSRRSVQQDYDLQAEIRRDLGGGRHA